MTGKDVDYKKSKAIIKSILSDLVRFFGDTLVSYLFALLFLIPFVNVALLRDLMQDSRRIARWKVRRTKYDSTRASENK